jgi:hypothetical protein
MRAAALRQRAVHACASARIRPRALTLRILARPLCARFFLDHVDTEPFLSRRSDAERAAFVAELHKLKTALFVELVERGELPLRPGVARLVAEARQAGVKARKLRSTHSARGFR